jgi:hypothetical protein
MTDRFPAVRRNAAVAILLVCCVVSGCRQGEGGWRGSVKERGGIRFVTNEGTGLDDGKVVEQVKPLWTIGGDGAAAGASKFGMLMWVDFDRAGNVYALDYNDQLITKLTPTGAFLGRFGGRGQADGGLSKSQRFAIVDDRLYFANVGNRRIEVLGAGGEVHPPLQLPEVKVPGELYFANDKFFVERRFVPDGHFVYVYDRNWKLERGLHPAESPANAGDVLRSHNTVCVAPDGIWIVHMLLNRIQKVGFDGKVILETSRPLEFELPKDKDGRDIPEILVHRACAVDPTGNLYVMYSNPENWKRSNDVYKFGPDGRLRQKAFTLPVFHSDFLRFDREGHLYYSDGTRLTKATIERRQES